MAGNAVTATKVTRNLMRPLPLLFLVYFGLRLLNVAVLAWFADSQGHRWNTFLLSWDSEWLMRAAQVGWPSIDLSDPAPGQTTWAWPPLVPLLARAVGSIAGDAATGPSLILVNMAAGAMASIVVYKMVCEFWDERSGLVAAFTWMAMPGSAVLVMGYAEGVFIALVFSALWAMQRHRYLLAAVLLVPAGMTKLQVVPFALALVAVVGLHWWRSAHSQPSSGVLIGSIALSLVSMLLWPAIVAARLGSWDAYNQIRATWNHETVPFLNTINWLEWLVTEPNRANLVNALALALAVIAGIWALRQETIPTGLKVVGMTMPVFLAYAGAGVSTVRYLLPDLVIALLLSRLVRHRWQMLLLGLVLVIGQIVWVAVFVVADSGSTPP